MGAGTTTLSRRSKLLLDSFLDSRVVLPKGEHLGLRVVTEQGVELTVIQMNLVVRGGHYAPPPFGAGLGAGPSFCMA